MKTLNKKQYQKKVDKDIQNVKNVNEFRSLMSRIPKDIMLGFAKILQPKDEELNTLINGEFESNETPLIGVASIKY